MSGQTQERVGFEAWLGIKSCGAAHDLAYEAFKAGAAWQRAQGAKPLPFVPCKGQLMFFETDAAPSDEAKPS